MVKAACVGVVFECQRCVGVWNAYAAKVCAFTRNLSMSLKILTSLLNLSQSLSAHIQTDFLACKFFETSRTELLFCCDQINCVDFERGTPHNWPLLFIFTVHTGKHTPAPLTLPVPTKTPSPPLGFTVKRGLPRTRNCLIWLWSIRTESGLHRVHMSERKFCLPKNRGSVAVPRLTWTNSAS